MADAGNRFKKLVYHYDLVSGKVNEVAFQPGNKDAFYHRYSYDAENRITHVETSHDSIYWENDAYYQYYKHGPLARTVLGQQQVQGIDNAYTIQGWLRGVNSTAVTPKYDMGADGAFGSQVAKDVFGFSLNYYKERDYSPIGTLMPFSRISNLKTLFNGNITAIAQSIPSLGIALDYTYYYDLLNRIVSMQTSKGMDTATNTWKTLTTLSDFRETVTYDANGNISTYLRNGNSALPGGLSMDKLTYTYKTGTNRLDFVYDSIPATNYDNDIDAQSAGNYGYDAIGNITSDTKGGIDSIKWTLYGKISRIKKTDGTVIDYTYDVAGNRISKSVNGVQTWYVRDATGNVMSVYTKGNNAHLIQTETNLFGSSRLGITTLNTDVEDTTATPVTSISGLGSGLIINFIRGKKFFELNNHLGNVLATVSDKRTAVSLNGSTIDHYEADIVSAQEYYPFGMLMPGRSFNSSKYRYGFNGQEKSDEIDPNGNHNTALFWEYDSRIGRRWNLDPKPTVGLSQYSSFNNNPIWLSDPMGDTSSPVTRFFGALKVIGSGSEMAAGAVLGVGTSWTGVGAVLGTAAVIHGADGASHGLTELITGEEAPTYTQQAINKGLQAVGISKNTANEAATFTDGALGLALTGGAGAVKNGSYIFGKGPMKPVSPTAIEDAWISALRSKYNISKRNNIAYLEGTVEGNSMFEFAASGQAIRQNAVGNPLNRFFTTFVVKGYDRLFDSEVKILENFANKYQGNTQIKATLELVSEKAFCGSCSDVVKQFQKMFPNVTLKTVSGVK